MLSGKPPTLWCDLMTWALPVLAPADSITAWMSWGLITGGMDLVLINISGAIRYLGDPMKYYLNTTLPISFAGAIEKTTAALKEEGFGVLTSIDIRDNSRKNSMWIFDAM